MIGELISPNCQTILATAIVEIYDNCGRKYLAKALLDSASQINFMRQDLCQKLGLSKIQSHLIIGGIGESKTTSKYSTTAMIKSRVSNYSTTLSFTILPAITGMQPQYTIDKNLLQIPNNIKLADPTFYISQQIDLLIGADIFFELFDGQHIKLGENGPTLMHSWFGLIISGKINNTTVSHSLTTNVICKEADDNLDQLVKQFWDFEKVPESRSRLSKEQDLCEQHFKQSTTRTPTGRFQVKLPFTAYPNVLGDSVNMAKRRFQSLERRLSNDQQLAEAYSQFLKQYEDDGHMTPIPWPTSFKGWFIMPHHCVLRPEKSTTKCRVVFDASAKTSNGTSLNDVLGVGPVVQPELIDILLRFRTQQYGVMADITAMYRQILIAPEDRKVQNIIWKNKNDEAQLFQLNTVTYGTASAPYLATRCLTQLAIEHDATDHQTAKVIKNDFYVDDLISGGSSLQQIEEIKSNVSKVLSNSGFQLHKWFSNHEEFLTTIRENERERTIELNASHVVKTLGVIWDAEADCFKFSYSPSINDAIITKRKVLSEMSKLFDPIGLIKPIIVKTKIFMQELWLKNLDWDDPIPDECVASWNTFLIQLTNLHLLKFPRYVLQANSKIELHGFADASTRAYGCVFYVRCIDLSGNIKVVLLTSRSKVAPISTVRSLPCLELCAAYLLAQYFEKLKGTINFHQCTFWSDSTIVLGWLREHASRLNTFVANRVSFTQEHTDRKGWRYVPSLQNPADLISRGTSVDELQTSIWLEGPKF